MKKAVTILLSALMLIAPLSVIPVSARVATIPQYYEWDFENAELNDTVNGVFTATTGNNTLTVKTPADTSLTASMGFNSNTVAAGYSVKSASVGALGNALYVADRYLQFGTDVHLAAKTPWKVEITGILIAGNRSNGTAGNGLASTAILANDQADDYLFINGDGTAFWFKDNNNEYAVNNSNSTNWDNSYRIGQNRVQKLTMWNEYDSGSGTWKIHWMVENQAGNDAWDNVECYTNGDYSVRDFIFSGIGSEEHYLTAARKWNGSASKFDAIEGYISSVKIWEDMNYSPVTRTEAPDYYEWNFDNVALNNAAGGIFLANTGNNTITVQTPKDTSLTASMGFNSNTVAAGATIKTASVASLGNALYAADRYLEFEKDIHLATRTPWKVEITGILIAGNRNGTAGNGLASTAILANDETDDYLFINGDATAFWFKDNNNEYAVNNSNSTNWDNSYRIGQNRVQKLTIWNQYDPGSGTWKIHWTVAKQNGTDSWDNVECFTNNDFSNRDFVFSGIGSEEHYLTAARQWNGSASKFDAIEGYISSIKIWENTEILTTEGMQLKIGTTAESSQTDIRLVGSINSISNFEKVGFVVGFTDSDLTVDSAGVSTFETIKVYNRILGGNIEYTPKSGSYYFLMEIKKIPNADFATKIYFRPYAERVDGTIIYGEAVSVSVNDLL